MFLFKITDALDAAKVSYALAGGFAVALHGAVRGTVDVDIVVTITKKNLLALEKALLSLGLVSRLPITAADLFAFRREYIQKRNLIAWSFVNPKEPIEIVDVIVTEDLAKLGTKAIRVGNRAIKVVSISDLIKMKQKSGRPQDVEDVKALKELSQ